MIKTIIGLLGLAGVFLGVCELYGWPWAAIVAGGAVYIDTIIPAAKP